MKRTGGQWTESYYSKQIITQCPFRHLSNLFCLPCYCRSWSYDIQEGPLLPWNLSDIFTDIWRRLSDVNFVFYTINLFRYCSLTIRLDKNKSDKWNPNISDTCAETWGHSCKHFNSNIFHLICNLDREGCWSMLSIPGQHVSGLLTETAVDSVWNVMAHAQKPDFVFRRNGRVHLTLRLPD